MAAVAKAAKVSYDAESARRCVYLSGFFSAANTAGKFAELDPVFIDSDGNHPVTILGRGLIAQWLEDSDNMTPGTSLYIGAAGALDTVTSGATAAIARAITKTEILVLGPV